MVWRQSILRCRLTWRGAVRNFIEKISFPSQGSTARKEDGRGALQLRWTCHKAISTSRGKQIWEWEWMLNVWKMLFPRARACFVVPFARNPSKDYARWRHLLSTVRDIWAHTVAATRWMKKNRPSCSSCEWKKLLHIVVVCKMKIICSVTSSCFRLLFLFFLPTQS